MLEKPYKKKRPTSSQASTLFIDACLLLNNNDYLEFLIIAVRSHYRFNRDIPKFSNLALVIKTRSFPPCIKSCENWETFKRVITN